MRQVCRQLEPHLPAGHSIGFGPFLYVFPGDERAYGSASYFAPSVNL